MDSVRERADGGFGRLASSALREKLMAGADSAIFRGRRRREIDRGPRSRASDRGGPDTETMPPPLLPVRGCRCRQMAPANPPTGDQGLGDAIGVATGVNVGRLHFAE